MRTIAASRGGLRLPSMLLMLVALGVLGALGYWYATRTAVPQPRAISANEPPADGPQAPAAAGATTPEQTQLFESHSAAAAQQISAGQVAQWITDVGSTDPQQRAAAIAALALAPKEQAIPALQSVLESGEPELDRQIALRSLHSLALEHGDSDGKIRDVLRGAIYHGDDEHVTQSAQAVLEDVEADMAGR